MALKHQHKATEQLSFDDILEGLPRQRKWVETVLSRLKGVTTIPQHSKVLEIGAAAGGNLVALTELGCQCEGIEPWEEARLNAIKLSGHLGIPLNIVDGTAEAIPCGADSFDIVCAFAVMEHVLDIERAVGEIYRVLKPGGVFWFSSASSMCPFQNEIRGFPFFGWYPDSLKDKIMYWAKEAKPHLIGYTETPAIHWFTPRKTRILLQRHGFKTMYDRWDLRGEAEGGRGYNLALRLIRSTKFSKTLADILVPGCSYTAIK